MPHNPHHIKTPDLKSLREQIGAQNAPEPTVITDVPKLPNGEVDLNALAEKVRENQKDCPFEKRPTVPEDQNSG